MSFKYYSFSNNLLQENGNIKEPAACIANSLKSKSVMSRSPWVLESESSSVSTSDISDPAIRTLNK